MTVFSIKNGTFSYKKDKKLIDNISLEIKSGESVTVLGPNGAGKTTFLRAMLGFLKWNSGDSFLNGKSIREVSRAELFSKVSYVPQAKNSTYSMKVFDTVLMGRGSRIGMMNLPKEEDYIATEKALKRLGIEHLKDRNCAEISGGELQMVLIARALAAEPEMIVLDEPESNLDFKNQLIILKTLKELTKEGMACIFNTHYPSHSLRYADKALMMGKDGNSIFGNANEIVTEDNIRLFFGVETKISTVSVDAEDISTITPVRII